MISAGQPIRPRYRCGLWVCMSRTPTLVARVVEIHRDTDLWWDYVLDTGDVVTEIFLSERYLGYAKDRQSARQMVPFFINSHGKCRL